MSFKLFHKHLIAMLISVSAIMMSSCEGRRETSKNSPAIDKALSDLDKSIKDAQKYRREKYGIIDSLRHLSNTIPSPAGKILLLDSISSVYRQINPDSAIYYSMLANSKADETGDKNLIFKTRLTLINALSTSGIFNEASRIFNSLETDSLSPQEKIDYWKTSRMLYSYAVDYLQENNIYTDNYKLKYIQSDDSLMAALPENDPFRRFVVAERLVSQRRWEEARPILENLMNDNEKENNLYGMAAYQLAEIYRQTGNYPKHIEALALSAESDVMGAVREGISLPTLATTLYERGELGDAFRYMNHALEEASSANVRIRTISMASTMAMIDRAYKKELEASRHAMAVFLIISLCFLVLLATVSISLVRNIRLSQRREKELAAISKKLQDYIGNFISLCANYSARLEQIGKLVTRKVKAGQEEDLLELIGSGRFAEEDNEEFYKLIDKAFLDIFPDFPQKLNRLLLPDQQIDPDEVSAENLTPELRIYACIRLGVEQSSRIARILHYSVNTVYSYRNRMRNRAINRDEFDNEVAKMGFS